MLFSDLNPPYLREACVESLPEAIRAAQAGADRLELCADLVQDGLTPAPDLVRQVVAKVDIPVKVMIRPRGGDFCYSTAALQAMERSILRYKEAGIQGFVTGVLTETGEVATNHLRRLCEAANPLPVTFHKAIDRTPDILQTLKMLKEMEGVQSVLSSGGAATALAGAGTLRQMIALAGKDLTIIAAGKITSQNLEAVHEAIGAAEYHGRRIV